MKIEFTSFPKEIEVEYLTKKINAETSEYGSSYPFGFFVYDDIGNIIAGVNGFVIYGVIYTDQLWVSKGYRNQGFGKELMDKVHLYGISEKCSKSTVSTMNFQNARGFYEKLGYKVDFERHGYIRDGICYFMSKLL